LAEATVLYGSKLSSQSLILWGQSAIICSDGIPIDNGGGGSLQETNSNRAIDINQDDIKHQCFKGPSAAALYGAELPMEISPKRKSRTKTSVEFSTNYQLAGNGIDFK
jgi:hypothetical protein